MEQQVARLLVSMTEYERHALLDTMSTLPLKAHQSYDGKTHLFDLRGVPESVLTRLYASITEVTETRKYMRERQAAQQQQPEPTEESGAEEVETPQKVHPPSDIAEKVTWKPRATRSASRKSLIPVWLEPTSLAHRIKTKPRAETRPIIEKCVLSDPIAQLLTPLCSKYGWLSRAPVLDSDLFGDDDDDSSA